MFSINLNANEVDAVSKMSRWGFTRDVDYKIISPTLYADEMKQRFHTDDTF